MSEALILSVIVPVYNGERYLTDILRKISQQTFKEYEVLFINDGSTDASIDLLRKAQKEDARIRVFNQDNHGICAARNTGLRNAQGEYVIFIDQDDDFDAGMFEDYVQKITVDHTDMYIFGKHCKTLDNDRIIEEKDVCPDDKICSGKQEISPYVVNIDGRNMLLTVWNCIYKKELLDSRQIIFDEQFTHGYEDTMFNIEAAMAGRSIGMCSNVHYQYFMRYESSTIKKKNPYLLQDVTYFCEKLKKKIVEYDADLLGECDLYIIRFFTKVYLKEKPHGFKEKKVLVKNICEKRILQDACAGKLKKAQINKFYFEMLKMFAAGVAKKKYLQTLFLLEILDMAMKCRRR
ncbi:MAG: glycosyltransferase [Lachnoclostridium sp.]|nr:glycosyltransferase [Lachnospira sp.]MCM1247220.1 glycosyltransferase [Lachnoclostridium sp.]